MISVFVYKDQEKEREQFTKLVSDYILMENIDMKVVFSTSAPYGLLEYVQENKVSDGLYFLEVDPATDMVGIELAARIRKQDKRGMIAFVIASEECMKMIYLSHVEAVGCLEKWNREKMEKEVKELIHLAQERLVKNEERMFVFKVDDKILSEPYSEILYFEKSVHNKNKVVMKTKKEVFEFYGTLKEVERRHESFYRAGRSYVFNIRNVKELKKKEGKVILINGEECFISAKQAAAFEMSVENRGGGDACDFFLSQKMNLMVDVIIIGRRHFM